jgi:hypothetical protein
MSSGPRIPVGNPGKFSTESRIVNAIKYHGRRLTVCRCRKLTTSSESIRHKPFKKNGVQICASQVDRSRVSRWT